MILDCTDFCRYILSFSKLKLHQIRDTDTLKSGTFVTISNYENLRRNLSFRKKTLKYLIVLITFSMLLSRLLMNNSFKSKLSNYLYTLPY